jgi:hypothetical protein
MSTYVVLESLVWFGFGENENENDDDKKEGKMMIFRILEQNRESPGG